MKKTIISLSVILAACGGGGGGNSASTLSAAAPTASPTAIPTSTPAPNISAAGLWKGVSDVNRTLTGLILPNGSFYVLYSRRNNANIIAGVVQGNGSISGNTFTSSNAKDFNLEGAGVLDAKITSTVVTKGSFNGSVSYPTSSYATSTYSSSYSTDFEVSPSLATVTGTYAGDVTTSAGTEGANVSISNSGVINGTGTTTGCTITGNITPRTDSNAYDVSLKFGASPCLFPNQTLTGISYFDASQKRLYAVAPNATRTDGVLFVGTKP
ncbi:hypothetical protein HZU75_05840 [Chitinibacter fontanus]|uniref:Uncharacterized protein n=1 Tax=Chitinibacter fontanus TaxID=1737446 RepID=A0A7D5ZFT4_9NEIS|nr:hypothetical protein [Chitinibacter fontanus]QLI81089.1 hypothetical protein HZU75_05840 [Chitinibacter fontanus]